MSSKVSAIWLKAKHGPFVSVFAIAIALQFIGEQFPFSPFPMYSGFSKETTVLYVTDSQNHVLAIKKVFRLDASKVKKAYNKALVAICKKKGYDDGDATPADIQAAGQYMIKFLPTQARGDDMAKKIEENGLRLYRVSYLMNKGGIHEETELVGASQP